MALNPNQHRDQSHNHNPNLDHARRSACDRCRGQKLRCVRAPTGKGGVVRTTDSETNSLATCERCLKARAICVNTILPSKRFLRTKNPNGPSSSSPSLERRPTPSSSQSDSQPHSYVVDRINTPGAGGRGGVTQNERPPSAGLPSQPTQVNPQTPGAEREPTHRDAISPSRPHSRLESSNVKEALSFLGAGTANSPKESGHWLSHGHHSSQSSRNFMSRGAPSASISTLDSVGFSAEDNITARTGSSAELDNFDLEIFPLSPVSKALSEKFHDLHAQNTDAGPQMDLYAASTKQPSTNSDQSKSHGGPDRYEETEDSKEEWIRRLSELSSNLLKGFNRISPAKLADILAFSPSPIAEGPDRTDPMNKSVPMKNTIGRILESSQTFLDILQYFKAPSSGMETRAMSECSYSDYWVGEEDTEMTNDALFPHDANDLIFTNSSLPTSGDEFAPPLPSSCGSALPYPPPSSSPTSRPDFPTTLAILTCYTCLLRMYDVVFSQIYHALLGTMHLSGRSNNLPASLPGLQLGGFDLDSHKDMQMEILIHISSKMLERIETTLGIDLPMNGPDSGRCRNDTGILDNISSAAILDAIFKQKDFGSSGVDGVRTALVKQTMEKIRELLNCI